MTFIVSKLLKDAMNLEAPTWRAAFRTLREEEPSGCAKDNET